MFNSPAGGANGLVQSPASGFVSPAAQIADGELVVSQINELAAQLAQKHPLIGPGELPQERVAGLVTDLAGKASNTELASGLAGKEPTIAEGGLAQSKVANLVTDLAGKASNAELASGLAGKADLAEFQEANTQRIQVDAALELSLAGKASSTELSTGLA